MELPWEIILARPVTVRLLYSWNKPKKTFEEWNGTRDILSGAFPEESVGKRQGTAWYLGMAFPILYIRYLYVDGLSFRSQPDLFHRLFISLYISGSWTKYAS